MLTPVLSIAAPYRPTPTAPLAIAAPARAVSVSPVAAPAGVLGTIKRALALGLTLGAVSCGGSDDSWDIYGYYSPPTGSGCHSGPPLIPEDRRDQKLPLPLADAGRDAGVDAGSVQGQDWPTRFQTGTHLGTVHFNGETSLQVAEQDAGQAFDGGLHLSPDITIGYTPAPGPGPRP